MWAPRRKIDTSSVVNFELVSSGMHLIEVSKSFLGLYMVIV
jgi:hypothetical protein